MFLTECHDSLVFLISLKTQTKIQTYTSSFINNSQQTKFCIHNTDVIVRHAPFSHVVRLDGNTHQLIRFWHRSSLGTDRMPNGGDHLDGHATRQSWRTADDHGYGGSSLRVSAAYAWWRHAFLNHSLKQDNLHTRLFLGYNVSLFKFYPYVILHSFSNQLGLDFIWKSGAMLPGWNHQTPIVINTGLRSNGMSALRTIHMNMPEQVSNLEWDIILHTVKIKMTAIVVPNVRTEIFKK